MSKIAFMFPGQGAQTVGMGRQLVETMPAAKNLFEEAKAILGYDLADLCFNGPVEKLNSTVISQPAIFVTSLAALESLRASDPAAIESCTATAGLSLGEYTALVFAGAMSFADALNVVRRRGEAMQAAADAVSSGMVSVLALDMPKVEEICKSARGTGVLEIANLLCPGNTVLSGTTSSVEAAQKLGEQMGGKTIRLAVAGAFHTHLMKPADQELANALAGVQIKPPRIPVWSNVDAQPHQDPKEIRELLVKQVVQPVLWEQSMRGMLAAGYERYFEIGPGRVLAGLLKRILRKAEITNVAA